MKQRIAVAVLVAGMLATIAGAAPPPFANILIYGPSLDTSFTTNAQAIAEGWGWTVTVFSDAQWAAASRSTFRSFDAIVIDDNHCNGGGNPLSTAEATTSVWGRAITGNVEINTSDPDYHADNGSPQAGYLLENGLIWATSGGGTGLYLSTGCYFENSGSFTIQGLGTFDYDAESGDTVNILDTGHRTVAGLNNTNYSNWENTVHAHLLSVPPGFDVIAEEGEGSPQAILVVRSAAVPAMPGWALAVLVMVLGGVAFAVLRRRHVTA